MVTRLLGNCASVAPPLVPPLAAIRSINLLNVNKYVVRCAFPPVLF